MNYFHEHSPELNWPMIDQEAFEAIIRAYDYRRDGWSDAVVYLSRQGALMGFINRAERYYIHPDLLEPGRGRGHFLEDTMTITNQRIEQFRREAADAGDLEAVAICQRALNQLDPWEDTPRHQRIDDQEAVTRALAMSIEGARAAVAEWIDMADAMGD